MMEPDGQTGTRLAAARREAHLSQRTLAAELGVSVRTMQNYEAGRFVPYRHLDALSRVLGRSPSWLLYGREQPDTDRLLASIRDQREQLLLNLERLRELGEQLVDNVSRSAGPGGSPPDEH
jgi:transcriptional regulator with XRE-family HTH domain